MDVEISERSYVINMAQKIMRWIKYLRSKWILIFCFGLVFAFIGFIYAYYSKPKYTADLTFVLSSNARNSGLLGLAGQFGIDLSSGGEGDMFAGDNIIELLKSRKIIKGALFRTIPHSSNSLINTIIDRTGMLKQWQEKEYLKQILPFPPDIKKLTPVQDSIVNELHLMLVKNYLRVEKLDKKLNFYIVSTTSKDEVIACYLSRFIVEEGSRFYIATKTKTAQQNLQMLQHEADSLRNLLGGAIESTATETDRTFNLNPAYQIQRSIAQQGQVRSTVLGTAYGEVVKNLELAKITLQKETPVYQVVDEPSIPLKKIKTGKIKFFVIGGILGGIFIIGILTLRKMIKELNRMLTSSD